MKTLVLAAALALVAGPALAAEKAQKPAKLVGPAQPIPYVQMDAYLKAPAKERANRDWWISPAYAAAAGADASARTAAPKKARTPPRKDARR